MKMKMKMKGENINIQWKWKIMKIIENNEEENNQK